METDIEYLIIHSTETEKGYVPERREYNIDVPCDILHFNGKRSWFKPKNIHPENKDTYKHVAYIGGVLNGKVTDTATWKQYDSLECIVMYHLLYNHNIKIACSSVFFEKSSGLKFKAWLKDIGVNKKNIM